MDTLDRTHIFYDLFIFITCINLSIWVLTEGGDDSSSLPSSIRVLWTIMQEENASPVSSYSPDLTTDQAPLLLTCTT